MTLSGLLTSLDGEDVPITLHRRVAPLSLVAPQLSRSSVNTPEPRSTVALPPPGNVSLNIHLGERIGTGATGLVYSVDIVGPEGSTGLPPLIIKLARPHRRANLARETWFYDELCALQGSTIPRCYGWFEADLPEDVLVEAWLPKMHEPSNDVSTPPAEWGTSLIAMNWYPRISLLLLERAGGKLPFGVPFTQDLMCVNLFCRIHPMLIDSTHSDNLHDAFREFEYVSVNHHDVRYSNILLAPSDPGSLPSLPSPFTGRTYQLRVIDLELCEKMFFAPHIRSRVHKSTISRIVDNVPRGFIVEPWE